MSRKATINRHPDDVFGSNDIDAKVDELLAPTPAPAAPIENRVLSSAPHASLLTEEVAALSASLGTKQPKGKHAYEPDAFVAAIREQHDKLMGIRTLLAQWNAAQQAREAELDAREAEVEFREKRVAAHEQLVEVKRGWFKRLFT